MKKKTDITKHLICLGLTAVLLLTGCTGGNVGADGAKTKKGSDQSGPFAGEELSDSQRFDQYTEEYFKNEIVKNTIDLHYVLAYPENYGIDDYEVTLSRYDIDRFEGYEQEILEMKEELESYNREELSESQQLTYDILMDCVETELPAVDLYLYMEPLDPLSGYQAEIPILLAEYTFRREKDVEDYLILLGEVDDVFESIIVFEKEKVKAGLFMADFAVDDVIEQCDQFIENPEENYMIEVFDYKIDDLEGLSEEEKESYKERNRKIILTEVIPGYEMLIKELETLKGSGTNDLGICYYEDGTRYYEYLLRARIGTDQSVSELKKRTSEFIYSRMEWIYETLENDPDLLYELYEGVDLTFLDDDPEQIIDYLIENTTEDFPIPPSVEYTIKYVHPSMEEYTSPAFYLTPPIDDVQNNVIYINRGNGNDDLFVVLAHEGYPGHLYQTVTTAQKDLPPVRSLFSFSGYTEGWADYVEYYSYDLRGMDKDLAQILAWDSGINVALCAYVDIGVNYEGWDRQDVLEFLGPFGIVSEESVNGLFELVVEKPGYYLNYFIGYLEFLRLREKAENTLEDDFVLKDFHQFILDLGPTPFYIIEDRMDLWMEEQKGS